MVGVYVLSGDRAAFRDVTTGRESESSVAIEAGLSGSEMLVADASALPLSNELRIRIRE